MKKEARKPTPDVERARQKVRGLTTRKTYHSVETEFGVLTLDDDTAKEPAAPRSSRNGRSRRSERR